MNSIKFWLHLLNFLLILTAGTLQSGIRALLMKFGIRLAGPASELRAVHK